MIQRFCFFLFLLRNFCFAGLADTYSPCECDQIILEGKIPLDNHRYHTFAESLKLLCARKANVIVETGTARYGSSQCLSDGCSTLIFAEWIKNHGGVLYSIDINAQSLQNAADALDEKKSYVHFIHSDSIFFLTHFNQSIDFLYLDSFDYDFGNPMLSQEHHLKEIEAAYPWLTLNSIVMIDDCALPQGGKGKLVIDYLLARGWKILKEEYQVILSQ